MVTIAPGAPANGVQLLTEISGDTFTVVLLVPEQVVALLLMLTEYVAEVVGKMTGFCWVEENPEGTDDHK